MIIYSSRTSNERNRRNYSAQQKANKDRRTGNMSRRPHRMKIQASNTRETTITDERKGIEDDHEGIDSVLALAGTMAHHQHITSADFT